MKLPAPAVKLLYGASTVATLPTRLQRALQVAVASQGLSAEQVVPLVSSVLATCTGQLPGAPQLRQRPQLPPEQHTPSTQLPDTQPVPEPHACPSTPRHTPAALQALLPLQVLPVLSAVPAALPTVRLQVPSDPQLRQLGHADVMQQTESRQVRPGWHSLLAAQPRPGVFF